MVSGQTLALWRKQAQQAAIAAGISPAEVDWLLQALTPLAPLDLRLGSYQKQPEIPLQISLPQLNYLWQQRLEDRVPLQYLVKSAPWRNFSLKVTPDVLIPRPETEILIDLAIAAAQKAPCPQLANGHWVDLGTGSGAIALGLAEAFPAATIHAVDASPAALQIAQENAQRYHLTHRIRFYQGSWYSPLTDRKGQISGMVSNPPYIPTALLWQLQPEVAQHEPQQALDGGEDGLECIRYLVQASPDYLRSGGVWLIEMMAGQADAVAQLLHQQGSYRQIQIFPDFAGIERFALAYRD